MAQVENHKEEVPFSYYEGLFAGIDPAEVSARLPFVRWDGSAFHLTLLGTAYTITFPAYSIDPVPALPVQTFLIRCLLECKDIPAAGDWKTFREMPWGELYMKPYTGRVLNRAAFTFGTRIPAFRAACEKMKAVPLKHGDAGFQFSFIGPYSLRLLVWEGDEEFPPNAQVLYSDNFSGGFAAEDRVVAGDILISAIKGNLDDRLS
ncbi:MAG: DUF3786 domain-containing protein [Faecousia sp.]